MAGKVKNEVEGEAKVTGEEQLQSFYESIVGILSAMQVADPYAQLFATALTTASNSADAGMLEKYTAALKKFNDTLAKTAEIEQRGIRKDFMSKFTDMSITDWTARLALPDNKMMKASSKKFRESSGKEKEKAALNLIPAVRMMKKYSEDSTGKTIESLERLSFVFAPSEAELKKLESLASEVASTSKKTKESVKAAVKSVENVSSTAENAVKKVKVSAEKNAKEAVKKIDAAVKKADTVEKKSASRRKKQSKKDEKQTAEEEKTSQKKALKRKAQPQAWRPEPQYEPERKGKKIIVSAKKEEGPRQDEGLLKKAEKARKARRGTTELRQLSDIENDIYKALSDKKNVTISSNFKALLDEHKKPVHDDEQISSYAALLSKSVNRARDPKTTEKIQSLVNEWNVSNYVNEMRSQARMPVYTGKETAIRSLMPQLKFIADPYGTDKKAVAQSKIPVLEKKINGINSDDSLSPEKRIENIRAAIDRMFQFATTGVTNLENEVRKAQTETAAVKAETSRKESPSQAEQKDAVSETVTQTAEQVKDVAEAVKENDKARKDIAEKAADSAEKEIKIEQPPVEKIESAAQALESANINVTNGYFDIDKLASAAGAGKKEEGLIKVPTAEEISKATLKGVAGNITRLNDAVYGNRALTMTDKGEFLLGDKNDILAWINDPTSVVQFITDALKKKSKDGKFMFSAEQIENEIRKAKAKSSYEGAELSHIDRHAVEIELKTKKEGYDNDKINQIVSERSYAMNTIKDILSSRNVTGNNVKANLLAAGVKENGEFDYDRVGILNNMYWSSRRSAQNRKGQERDAAQKQLNSMDWILLNRKMSENGFSDEQIGRVNAFKEDKYGLQLGNKIYQLILNEIREAGKKAKQEADKQVESGKWDKLYRKADKLNLSADQRSEIDSYRNLANGLSLASQALDKFTDKINADKLASKKYFDGISDKMSWTKMDKTMDRRGFTDGERQSVLQFKGVENGRRLAAQQLSNILYDKQTQKIADSEAKRSEKEAVKASNLEISAKSLSLKIEKSSLADDVKKNLLQDLSAVKNGTAKVYNLSTVQKRFAYESEKARQKNGDKTTGTQNVNDIKRQYSEERKRNKVYDEAVKYGVISKPVAETYKAMLSGSNDEAMIKFTESLTDKIAKASAAAEYTEIETRLYNTVRKACRNGITEFTDRKGSVKSIDSADTGDIAAIRKAIAEKPEKDINNLVSGMDGRYLSNAITSHIDKYISRLSSYDKRFLGRGNAVNELKNKSVSDIYKESSKVAAALAEPLKKKINEILTSGASDRSIIKQLTRLKDGGLENEFKDFFKSFDEKIHEILEKADTEGPKKNADVEKGEIDIDKGSPFLSVYENEQYKLNNGLIQQETERIQQLLANKDGASEDETKKINSEINKSINVIEALRKQNKALETQAKNLVDEQKKGRMSFGKSMGESIKAGLYRWNQNAQNRGGIAGAFAKFGANRMEGGALQKLLGVNVGGILGLAVAKGGKNIAETVSRIVKDSLADFGNIQTIQTNLGTVYGSQSAADMRFADIAKYATKSPFGVQQTSDFAVLLKQSGVYENDLMKTLSMIGDVAGGNQEKYSRIANNYAQIVAANKATAMDLRQFANAGIPIYKAIKDYLASQDKEKYGGLDTAAVRKMTQNGEITSDVIDGVFKMLTGKGGAFNNSVQRGAKTYKAQMQNMQDIRQLAGAAVGETLFSLGQNWNGGIDKESKSIFQKILDFSEKIYNGIEDQFSKWNLERKHEIAENDKERRKNIEDAVKFYKDNPEYDVNGVGLEYYEDLLKNYKTTFDYAEIRATNSQLFDLYTGKADRAKKIADSKVTELLEVQLISENRIYEIKDSLDRLAVEGKQNTEEYKELLNQMDFLSQRMADLGGTVAEGAAGIQSAVDKAEKEEKENREQSKTFLYWKNQTLAERAMSTAYGINAKTEKLNKNSAPNLASWIEEEYKGTSAYKEEQERQRKEIIQRAEAADKWLKDNNVTDSNRFGFVSGVKSMTQLADNLNDYFTSEEGRITREYITNDDNNLTKEGVVVMKNQDELIRAILTNFDIAAPLRDIQLQKMGANGTEYNATLTSILGEVLHFAKNPDFGTRDAPSDAEKDYYANIAVLYKLLDSLESKTVPLTKDEENLRTIISKILSPQSVSTVDTSKLKAVKDLQAKEYIPLWKRLANQSLGVPIQMLTNNRSNTGALYDITRTRSQTGQIATAMLQSGSSLGDIADLMAYKEKANSRINGGATTTRQIDWKKTSDNLRSFALSIDSATDVTSAYVSSIQAQQSQVYSMLTGWKSMEDFDKMTDEKLKDSLGQVRKETKKTITEYASTFGYSGTISDLEKNVIDLTNKIEESDGETRRIYKDELTQQMSVLDEMLKIQRKTAESVLAIKNSITDLSQQTESSEDEIFMNTVQAMGVQPEGVAPMSRNAQELFWKSMSQSVNSQQSLVQTYDDNKSGRISYKELREHLLEIFDALDGIEKNTKADNGITPVAMRPVEKQPLVAITSEFTGKGLRGLSRKEQAEELINAVKGRAAGGELHGLYMQTDFTGLDWGRCAKDNGLSLEQALSVTHAASNDIPFIKRGFESANGSMKIEAESVTMQAKKAEVTGKVKTAGDDRNVAADKASEAAAASQNLQMDTMWKSLYSSGSEFFKEDYDANIKSLKSENKRLEKDSKPNQKEIDKKRKVIGAELNDLWTSYYKLQEIRNGSDDPYFKSDDFNTLVDSVKAKIYVKQRDYDEAGVDKNRDKALRKISENENQIKILQELIKNEANDWNFNAKKTDIGNDPRYIGQHLEQAINVPFVLPVLNSLFGGRDGTRFQPYTSASGEYLTQAGNNTRRQQLALNFLDERGISGAADMDMKDFVDASTSLMQSPDKFKQIKAAMQSAGEYAGVKNTGERMDEIGKSINSGSIDEAKEKFDELVEDMSSADLTSYVDGQLKSLANTMKEAFSSNLLSGVTNSFVKIGENLRDGEDATSGMYKIWKNVGKEITGTIGASMTSTGLSIAGAAAVDHKWGLVANGLAMAASGGICSIASGLLSDSSDSSEDSKDDGREQRIQNLKDALSDLIDQAKTDAEYYEKNLLHKNALSANEAVSTRSVNDAIITPNGSIVTTHPDDYLIATKTPGSLMGSGGQANVTVQVNPVVINNSSANITAKTETRENDDGSVDIVTTIVDVMNMALATGKADEGMAAYEANRNGRSVVS